MVTGPLITILAQALPPLIAVLPHYLKDRRKNKELDLLRTDLYFLQGLVTRANARNADLQVQMTEQQNQIIRAFLDIVQKSTNQMAALTTPQIRALPPQVVEQQAERVVVDARRDLETRLPMAAQLAPTEEVLDALMRLIGWQMTATTFLTWNINSAKDSGWGMLGYYAYRSLYFIAVSGSDPSSALIRSYRCACDRNPSTENEWQQALEIGERNFADFEQWRDKGIYDLVMRLQARYPD